jgi:hypothetical protein
MGGETKGKECFTLIPFVSPLALPTLWHAFLFLGLRFFPLFFFLLGGLHCFFL